MIPVVVFWTKHTATVGGRVLKFVPCEGCGTEYVYVLEREGVGVGTDVYLLNPGAEGHALSAAEESLRQALENDFDPVPCPACGHYQPYMFPKLLEDRAPWAGLAAAAALGAGILGAVVGVYWTVAYSGRPTDAALWRMVGAWGVVAVSGLAGAVLASARRAREQRFDPNAGDPQARIAAGRRRAVTRAEFEAGRQPAAADRLPDGGVSAEHRHGHLPGPA